MSKTAYTRACHIAVDKVLAALNADFLENAQCFFGGGTRIVLELGEYRESADIDFLCSDRNGYRALRSTIDSNSLGKIASTPLSMLRDVRADQYGIRTVLNVDGEKLKFEIVNEARIDLSGVAIKRLHVPSLDKACCFAEKLLANDDRGMDESVLYRDAVDLAFMVEAWGMADLNEGAKRARTAYGDRIDTSIRRSARLLLDNKAAFNKCVQGLRIAKQEILLRGLRMLAEW